MISPFFHIYTPSSSLYLFPQHFVLNFPFTVSFILHSLFIASLIYLSHFPINSLFTDTFVLQLPSFRLSIFVIFHFLFPLYPCYLLAIFSLVIPRPRSFLRHSSFHSFNHSTSLVSIQCITCTPFLYFRYSCPWMALPFVVYLDPM
jgi:hypothetical protein